MTPAKEKAQELVDMMGMSTSTSFNHINGKNEPIYRNPYAIQCAIKAVDEIIKARPTTDGMIIGGTQTRPLTIHYWQEVKQEIEKL